MFKKNKKLAWWQDKLRKARAAYADELNNMDLRTAYYEGTARWRRARPQTCATLCTSCWKARWTPPSPCRG